MNKKEFTIGKSLWAVACFSLSILIGLELFNIYTRKQLSSRLNDLGTTQLPAVRSMSLADMMHDGLRAVAFRAMVAEQTQNKDEMKAARAEFEDFSKNIKTYLEDIEKMNVSQTTKDQV